MTIGVLFAVFLMNAQAEAFTLLNEREPRWKIREVKVNFDVSQCTPDYRLDEYLQEAIDLWNSVPFTSLKLVKGEPRSVTIPLVSQMELGTILAVCDSVTDFPGAGRAHPNEGADSELIGGAVVITTHPSEDWTRYSRTTRVATLAHEIGHCLGFGHSRVQGSLMGTHIQSLADDDKAAMQYLYPRDELQTGFYGCGISGAGGGNGRSPMASLLLMSIPLLIVLIFRARQRGDA